MLAIGRGLMAEPRLLILHEPSLGTIAAARRGCSRSSRGLSADGLSVLLVEQNMVQSLEVASRAYILETSNTPNQVNRAAIVCGHLQEQLPIPIGDGWWRLIPVWDPGAGPAALGAARPWCGRPRRPSPTSGCCGGDRGSGARSSATAASPRGGQDPQAPRLGPVVPRGRAGSRPTAASVGPSPEVPGAGVGLLRRALGQVHPREVVAGGSPRTAAEIASHSAGASSDALIQNCRVAKPARTRPAGRSRAVQAGGARCTTRPTRGSRTRRPPGPSRARADGSPPS